MNVMILTGSNRSGATSTKLAEAVGRRIADAGHEVYLFDLFEKPVPLYNPDEDYEGNHHVNELKTRFLSAHAIVLASPEYHGSISGVLKNALDHLGFEHFDGKAVLAVASAGGAVGVSSLTHIQTIVRNLHGINCPEWISIGAEQRTFDEEGWPADSKVRRRLEKTTDYFVQMARRLNE